MFRDCCEGSASRWWTYLNRMVTKGMVRTIFSFCDLVQINPVSNCSIPLVTYISTGMRPQHPLPQRSSPCQLVLRNFRGLFRRQRHEQQTITDGVLRVPDLPQPAEASYNASQTSTTRGPSFPPLIPGLEPPVHSPRDVGTIGRLESPAQPTPRESGQPTPVPPSLFSVAPSGDDASPSTPLSETSQITTQPSATRNRFSPTGYFTPRNGVEIFAMFLLDTGADVSIMQRSVFNQLGLPLEPLSINLVPFHSRTDPITIRSVGIVRQVPWHFNRRTVTYTADFHVIDTDQYNVIVGRPAIEEWLLLQPSADIGPIAVRQLR